jgi:hypothetical protein
MDIWDLAASIGFHPTESDKSNMNNHKFEGAIFIDCAVAATERVLTRFGAAAKRDDNEANAFKHTIWSGFMVYGFTRHLYRQTSFDFNTQDSAKWINSLATGVQKAKYWASGHENYSSWENSDESRRMDYKNNEAGREIARILLLNGGSKLENATIWVLDSIVNQALTSLRSGRLTVINREGKQGYY